MIMYGFYRKRDFSIRQNFLTGTLRSLTVDPPGPDSLFVKMWKNSEDIAAEIERAQAVEKSLTLYVEDSDTLHFTKVNEESGTTLSGNLKLSKQKGQQLTIISTQGGITEGLYLNVSLNYDDLTGILSLLVNDEVVNSYNLPLEQFLDSELTHYDEETKKIILVFREQGKDPKYVEIPIGDLVDTYTAGNGLKLENNQFSVKINKNASEDFITVDEDGLSLTGIENKISEYVSKESERAKEAESKIATDLQSEVNRAIKAEAILQDNITNESSRALEAESLLQSNIDKETLRATGVESGLTQRLDANVLNINQLNTKIQTETERATSVEAQLSTSLSEVKDSLTKESERAQSAEAQIITNYTAADAEILRQSKEYTDSKVTIESERSQAIEKEIKDIIGSEFSTANTINQNNNITEQRTETIETDIFSKTTGKTVQNNGLAYGYNSNSIAQSVQSGHDGGELDRLREKYEVMKEMGLNLDIVSLAKREEEVFLPNKTQPVIFALNSPALHLFQRIRDEAHRFAITFHRQLRSKNMTK